MEKERNKVFVAGMGIVSALGIGVEKNLKQLLDEQSGIGRINHLDTKLAGELIAGEVPCSNEELISISRIKNTKGISRAALLGIIASREATKNIDLKDSSVRTGFISGTTAESMTNIEQYLNDFLTNDSKNEYVESQDWGFSTELICQEIGISGYRTTINTACSSAANAIMTGARMIKHQMLDRLIVGGTDALSKVMLNGFHALMIVDPKISKPFDNERQGLNLGEGAAFLVIESERIAQEENIFSELRGYGNSNDAFHLTALSPDGVGTSMAMENALESGGLDPVDITCINAHGTGTENNDLSEALGMIKLFGNEIPKFSSTKPYTGHTLGSSAALEAVFSILSLTENMIFPNLNFKTPMNECSIRPETRLVHHENIQNILSNSFGFGGNNTSLLFSKCNK